MSAEAEDLCTMADFAAEVGVKRQAVHQALGRSTSRPSPLHFIGGQYIFSRADLRAWWTTLHDERFAERRRRYEEGGFQLNVRLGRTAIEELDKLREPGETRTSAARRILHKTLTGNDLEFVFAKGSPRVSTARAGTP